MKTKTLILLMLCASCSSLNRSMVIGALVGSAVGSIGGAVFSPNEESLSQNAYMFGVIGAGAGAAAGYALYDDPRKPVSPMLLDEPAQTHQEVPLFDFSPELKEVRPEVNFKPVKKYEVPQEKLPPELEGKVKKQIIIEYEAEARTIELNNRTIQISPFKAWEHTYEN